MDYTKEAARYQKEVSGYLGKVRRGRRVAKYDPQSAEFNEQSESIRQLEKQGVKDLPPPALLRPSSDRMQGMSPFSGLK